MTAGRLVLPNWASNRRSRLGVSSFCGERSRRPHTASDPRRSMGCSQSHLLFWVIKPRSTAMGESTSDSFVPTMKPVCAGRASSALIRKVTSCGPVDRSRDRAYIRRTPKTLQLPDHQRRQARSLGGLHSGADSPRRPESERVRCPPCGTPRTQRADTCFLATRPRRLSGHRLSPRSAQLPAKQPGNWRSGARRHRRGRMWSHARFAPASIAPTLTPHRPVDIPAPWFPRRSSSKSNTACPDRPSLL